MRPVHDSDICDAARVLLAAPEAVRTRMCRRMIKQAQAAAAHVDRTGKRHPLWGNGTLTSAARQYRLARMPRRQDPDFCCCMETVLTSVIRHRLSRLRN